MAELSPIFGGNDFIRRFENWRQSDPGVLKTAEDWQLWCEYRERGKLRSDGALTGRGALVDQAKREFLRQYSNRETGYSGKGYRQLAEWLTENGYKTNVDAIKNAKRAKRSNYDWNSTTDADVITFMNLIKEGPTQVS